MYFFITPSPWGNIALTATDEGLTALSFLDGKSPINIPEHYQETPERFSQVCQQLVEYFAGNRQSFDIALAPQGTVFQKKVWHALTMIPYGQSKSYSWIAKQIKNEKAVRAVGAANGANPIALIIPCHRVIGANGKLTGYAGGLGLKAKILMHEGVQFSV